MPPPTVWRLTFPPQETKVGPGTKWVDPLTGRPVGALIAKHSDNDPTVVAYLHKKLHLDDALLVIDVPEHPPTLGVPRLGVRLARFDTINVASESARVTLV